MIVTTTMQLEGYKIIEYRGLVRGIVVRSPTIMQGLMGGLKNIVGGRIGALTTMCEQAREQAYEVMMKHARQVGANAIVGVQYDAASVGAESYSATEVICFGTAVVIKALDPK